MCIPSCAGFIVPFVIQIVQKASATYGDAGDWLLYITMPNYCVFRALSSLQTKHAEINGCSMFLEDVDLTMFCEMLRRNGFSSRCCPGELQMSSIVISQILCTTSHESYFLNWHKISLISSCLCTNQLVHVQWFFGPM